MSLSHKEALIKAFPESVDNVNATKNQELIYSQNTQALP